MRIALLMPLAAVLLSSPALAAAPEPGRFRLAEGPDVAGELVITSDGQFEYFLIAGALDERAQGRWELQGEALCLFTEPKPVPATFVRSEAGGLGDEAPTLLVTWPNGRGIAGIDFLIGFEQGDSIEGYTQEYGWTMPEDDLRLPLWIEVSEPIYGLSAPRFDLGPQDNGRLQLILTPNDLGVVDFDGTCLNETEDGATLHRKEGDMRFKRVAAREAPGLQTLSE